MAYKSGATAAAETAYLCKKTINLKKPLTIFHFAQWYPNRLDSLEGIFVKRHVEAISKYANVVVIHAKAIPPNRQLTTDHQEPKTKNHQDKPTPNPSKERNNPFPEKESISNGGIRIDVNTDPFPQIIIYYKKGSKLSGFINHQKALWKGYKKALEFFPQPDLMHLHILARSGLIPFWLKLTKGIPYMVSEHWTRYTDEDTVSDFKGWRPAVSRVVGKNAAAITAVSDHLRRSMMKWGITNRQFQVIPNVVDVATFNPVNLQRDGTTFIHVSNFHEPAKNVHGILEAAAELKESLPTPTPSQEGIPTPAPPRRGASSCKTDNAAPLFKILLVGRGPERAAAEAKAKALGLEKEAIFTGSKTAPELNRLMNQSDALVMFSNFENLPVVILEAFAAGLPVIATDVGGIKEHLDPERGILIEKNNKQQLVEAMRQIVQGKQFDRQKLVEYAQQHFSYEAIGQSFIDLYQNVVGRK